MHDAVPSITVTGGGPVIQILPGPFPFPDSAGPILQAFGEEHEGLESQMKDGPYSNKVTPISGRFTISAWDLGAVRDSVDGTAEFTSHDGSRWRLVLDRVQTRDVPHHPRFGGVIMGLYYHGSTLVHTPLVPTINSKVALWSIGHLYRDDALVTDHAMVHVMLLSRTRRAADFALECWDCSRNPIEELQLQILPGPGEPKLDAPGGFLFVNCGRLEYVADRPVAALAYSRRQHLINVFLWPAGHGSDAGPTSADRQGYHLLHWNQPDYTYWVVSELGIAELKEFAGLLRGADSAAAIPWRRFRGYAFR